MRDGEPDCLTNQALLIRMGCVNASSIVRVARQAGSAPAEDPNADVTVLGREIMRHAGVANMSVTLATTIIADSVEGVVSEIFWAIVDVVGLGVYFRNVARCKERYDSGLPARPPAEDDADGDAEEVYTEDATGVGQWSERHIRRINGEEDMGSAAAVALVLHKTQKGVVSIWAAAGRWWQQRADKKRQRQRQRKEHKIVRRLRKAQRSVAAAEEALFEADATASYCISLLTQADKAEEMWRGEADKAEVAYALACREVQEHGADSLMADTGVTRQVMMERAEAWLLEASTESALCQARLQRCQDEQAQAFQDLRQAEALQATAIAALAKAEADVKAGGFGPVGDGQASRHNAEPWVGEPAVAGDAFCQFARARQTPVGEGQGGEAGDGREDGAENDSTEESAEGMSAEEDVEAEGKDEADADDGDSQEERRGAGSLSALVEEGRRLVEESTLKKQEEWPVSEAPRAASEAPEDSSITSTTAAPRDGGEPESTCHATLTHAAASQTRYDAGNGPGEGSGAGEDGEAGGTCGREQPIAVSAHAGAGPGKPEKKYAKKKR